MSEDVGQIKDTIIEELLRTHIAKGREHTQEQVQKTKSLSRLNAHMIYLCSAGHIPNKNLQDINELMSVVLEK